MRIQPLLNQNDLTTMRRILNICASQLSENNGTVMLSTGTETRVPTQNVMTSCRVLLTPNTESAANCKYYVKEIRPGYFIIGHEAGTADRSMTWFLTEIY